MDLNNLSQAVILAAGNLALALIAVSSLRFFVKREFVEFASFALVAVCVGVFVWAPGTSKPSPSSCPGSSDERAEPMTGPAGEGLRTYTRLYRMQRKLYSFRGARAPVAASIQQWLVGLTAGAVWVGGLVIVGFRPSPAWLWLWALPPVGAGYLAGQDVAESKTAPRWAASQLRCRLLEPAALDRLAPEREPAGLRLTVTAWRPPTPTSPASASPADAPAVAEAETQPADNADAADAAAAAGTDGGAA